MEYSDITSWWNDAVQRGEVHVDMHAFTCYYPNSEEKAGEYDNQQNIGWLNEEKEENMKFNSNETEVIPPELIAGYIIQRSPTDKFKFNVMAVDNEGDFLFIKASDLTFEKASAMVEVVNREHFPVVPSPTEVAFVQIGGESKVYNITAK